MSGADGEPFPGDLRGTFCLSLLGRVCWILVVLVVSMSVMGTRRVLTDEMWAELEPLLPDRTPRRGGRWRDHREVVEAIIWRFRTGSPWRDLPAPDLAQAGGVREAAGR